MRKRDRLQMGRFDGVGRRVFARARRPGGLAAGWCVALLALAMPAAYPGYLKAESQKETVGWIERVKVYPGGITVRAKLDTGAKTASLDCACIQPIEKENGEKWVSFKVTNFRGETIAFERKIERIAKIKRHYGGVQERYVVRMGVCLKNTYRETEVNLVDRSGFNYQMLIGRKFLKGQFLIDPDAIATSKPDCPDAPNGDS